jgi:hypothetical protein
VFAGYNNNNEDSIMGLNVKAFAIAAAIVWGLAMLAVGLANMTWPEYGGSFLRVVASIYPGHVHDGSLYQVIIGALYGAVDALIGGAVFAWIYNLLN